MDASGQAHEWLLLMLDFEHNRWFVRDPERKGRAWKERPAKWTASPKKSHMTFAYTNGLVEIYEEHEHTLLAQPSAGGSARAGAEDSRPSIRPGCRRPSFALA